MKKRFSLIIISLIIAGCAASAPRASASPRPAEEEKQEQKQREEINMFIKINETPAAVSWEDNGSVSALAELAGQADLVIPMSMYGGFEQVGPLGTRLERDDENTVTSPGDIVLYSGDQIVVFYGSNTWAYTRLGHITDKTPEELKELLGNGDVTLTISMEEK